MAKGNKCFSTTLNWRCLLSELCHKWELPEPTYRFAESGPQHKQTFHCTVTLTTDNVQYSACTQGTGKKDSSTLAARKLFKEIYGN